MSEWKARRFWKAASVDRAGDGFAIRLDGRPVRTPGKSELVVPYEGVAQEIAAEWNAQEGVIDPRTMPFTRMANSAIEKVAPQRAEVAAMLAGYGDSDLLCYRAEAPEELVARQDAAWDPLLDWAADRYDARLFPVQGVMYQAQPDTSLAALAAPVHAMTAFELTAFHDLVALSGSLVIALAAAEGYRPPETLWQASRIDEDWQAEQWGLDEEAARAAEAKSGDFLRAHRFFALLRPAPGNP